jgi:Rrf2 family protein
MGLESEGGRCGIGWPGALLKWDAHHIYVSIYSSEEDVKVPDGMGRRALDRADICNYICYMKSSNQFSDALHVMAHLVGQDGPRTSEQLATCLPTHPVVIRRLLAALQRGGLVRTVRGHGGGSQLAREPAQITLHDVYVAIGAPALLHTGARETGRGCPVQQVVNEALDDSYRQAQALLEQRLRGTTLATLGEAFARHLAHHAAGVPHAV